MVGEVRGTGHVAAVEFVAGKAPATRFPAELKVGPRLAKACLDRGLITRALPASDTLAFSPPFVISEAQVDEVVATARAAADAVMDELVRDGHRFG